MAENPDIKLLDHELAEDELSWVNGIHRDFTAARAAFTGSAADFNAKETLRDVLGRKANLLPTPMDLTGDGPWRNGRTSRNRLAACVFLQKIELHRHAKSRTDQFPMYVTGETEAFSETATAPPVVIPVETGAQFHNPPNAPHAFLPKDRNAAAWEIAFIAITPRNLKEDTQAVSEATRAVYKRMIGLEAPVGI